MLSFQLIGLIILGLTAGVLAGMFGIGGGAIMVPVMTFILGFTSKTSAGTSLAALLLPFGILGVLEYYRHGEVNLLAALILVVGLFVGTFFGAKITLSLPDIAIKRAFGIFLLLLSVRYLTAK